MSRSSTGRKPRRRADGQRPTGGKDRRRASYKSRSAARSLPLLPIGVVALLLAIAVGLFFYVRASTGPSTPATADNSVDGIQCQGSEQLAYHVHAHLAIYVNGRAQAVPQGIGIGQPWSEQQTSSGPYVAGGSCLYWLHTHDQSGIIHVESPSQRQYTLGNFFDVWRQPLTSNEVGNARGKVTVYVDGQPYAGNPRDIQLDNHKVIQLDVGDPAAPPAAYTFPSDL